MAIKVISNSLLQIVIRRSFLKPLVEIMSQVFVQSASCKEKNSHLFISKCTQLTFPIQANVKTSIQSPLNYGMLTLRAEAHLPLQMANYQK